MRLVGARRAGAAGRIGALALVLALLVAPDGAAPALAYARPDLPDELREESGSGALRSPILPDGSGAFALPRPFNLPGDAPTLAPPPASVDRIDAVRLTPRRAAVFRGSGEWDDGFTALKEAFALLERRTAEAGVAPVGRPFMLFTKTDDRGFRFSAMLPVGDDAPELATIGLEEGESPSGHALRFVHAGPFIDIDATYDLITSHLEAEGFEAQENFVEEYVVGAADERDPALVVFIYVFLR
ncbi:MAG: GyrI-like domain-containing protein [Microvirga sp.]|nr:GyrI-like domain-containing protein [Microvirga sp.]